VDKPKQTTTAIHRERIKGIKERLEAAIAEHRRIQSEMAELENRHPLETLRDALRRQMRRLRYGNRTPG